MSYITPLLPYIQIGLAILLVAAVLLQRTSSELGGAFGGGDNFSSAYHTRRGFEKTLFTSTIIISILFIVSSILALILR
ncbi:MAG: preprotein translocase subunit SecG [Candidatus Taylorbacteria bacterium]|nr:preprotein translocase subunit SecG [Candidatus Taylorbacteria bacterium]